MDASLTQVEKLLATAIWKRLSDHSAPIWLAALTLAEIGLLDRLGIEELDEELAASIKLFHPMLSKVAAERLCERYFQTYSRKGNFREHWELRDWKQSMAPHEFKLRELLSRATCSDNKLAA